MIKDIKELIKYILKIGVKLMLILLIVLSSFSFLSEVFYNKEVDYGDGFKALPNNSMDIIALGSSHLQYSFIPSIIYNITGLYSYSLGTGCQPYSVSYEMLKESLKTQSPKLVILEVYTALPLKPGCEGDGCYVLAEYQMSGEEKINTISMIKDEEKKKEYYNDFLNYHNNWKEIESFDDLKPKYLRAKAIDPNFGYIPWMEEITYDYYWRPNNIKNTETYYQELNDEDLSALDNIKKLCDDKDIQLLLYMAPMDGLDEENLSFLEAVWRWADENEVDYVDFTDLAAEIDFYMQIHSGSFHSYLTGAVIMSETLAKKIDTYSFKHIENDKLNYLYNHSSEYLTSWYLKEENRPATFIKVFEGAKGTIAVRYHKVNQQIQDEIIEAIIKLGVKDFDINKNLYLVIEDGEIIEISNYPITEGAGKHNIKVLPYGIEIDGILHNSGQASFTIGYINEFEKITVTKNVFYQYSWWTMDEYIYDRNW